MRRGVHCGHLLSRGGKRGNPVQGQWLDGVQTGQVQPPSLRQAVSRRVTSPEVKPTPVSPQALRSSACGLTIPPLGSSMRTEGILSLGHMVPVVVGTLDTHFYLCCWDLGPY